MFKLTEDIYQQIVIHHQIKLFDELLLPEKGNYFTSNTPIFHNIEKKIELLREFAEYTLLENTNTAVELISFFPVDETTARLSLLELIETTDIRPDESSYLFDRNTMKRYFTANGKTAIEEFTVKSYKDRFKTFTNSFYFIVSLAVYSTFCMEEYEKHRGVSGKAIFLHSPLDWTVALYNCLCYHEKKFREVNSLKE